MPSNRRQYSRVQFQTDASLFLPNGELAVEIVDLSLKGALVRPQGEAYAKVGSNCVLKIRLDNLGTTIRMECAIVHHQGDLYGLYCTEIDLDSITHLRHLIALNLGDEALLEREFRALTSH
ncbi:MAG: PilZ domain-containing protein [Bacteroidota bacterium]